MYIIQKKTPDSNWYTIHRDYDRDTAIEFLKAMAAGGYDRSYNDGSFDADELTARVWDEGDLILFRAVET